MNKKIVIATITLVAIGSVFVYYKKSTSESVSDKTATVAQANTTDSNGKYDNNLAAIKWLQRYPQLKTIPAGSMTANIDKLRTSESISALIGPIDNPYGVRNDILDAILTIVPADNPKMLEAAIKMGYYDNLADFSPSDESKLFFARKFGLAMYCTGFLDSNKDSKNSDILVESFIDLARNTDERAKWGYNLDHDVFAWKTLGTGLSDSEENELCSTGDY